MILNRECKQRKTNSSSALELNEHKCNHIEADKDNCIKDPHLHMMKLKVLALKQKLLLATKKKTDVPAEKRKQKNKGAQQKLSNRKSI
jgi:hypothetical protein